MFSLDAVLHRTAPPAAVIQLSGTLIASSTVNVALSGAATNSTAWFVLGLTQLDAPFKGGVMVPDVNVLAPFPTGGAGAVNFSFGWPTGVPAGFPFWTQFWVQDAGGPKGFAASNAVKGTAP